MKTQISYKKIDGSTGVALINGDASSAAQAKRELANFLHLPQLDAQQGGADDSDIRLREAGIDPSSVIQNHISE